MKTFMRLIILCSVTFLLGKADLNAQNEPQQEDPVYWASTRTIDPHSSLLTSGVIGRLSLDGRFRNNLSHAPGNYFGKSVTLNSGWNNKGYLLFMTMLSAIHNGSVMYEASSRASQEIVELVNDYNTGDLNLRNTFGRLTSITLNGANAAFAWDQALGAGRIGLTALSSEIAGNNSDLILALTNQNTGAFGGQLRQYQGALIPAANQFIIAKRANEIYRADKGYDLWVPYNYWDSPTDHSNFMQDATNTITIYPLHSKHVTKGANDTHTHRRVEIHGDLVAGRIAVSGGVGRAFDGWADYVFEPDYDLRSLNDLEAYIKENGHLPEVLSTEEVKEQGLDLVNMDITLLKKVEELTLYIIEQNKQLEEQLNEMAALKQRMEALEQLLEANNK